MTVPGMNKNLAVFRHADFCFNVVEIGAEGQKAIIVDNFVSNPESLIEYAIKRSLVSRAEGLYPGLRSPPPDRYPRVVFFLLSEIICDHFGLQPSDIAVVDSAFSVVATLRERLTPYQQIPHYDKPHPNEIALVHYLCDSRHGGTSFYRHRSSGYEYIDQERVVGYRGCLQQELQEVGLPQPPSYINGDTPLFERIHSVEARFNRCLIYRCSSLHSGDISSNYAFDMNPWTGRFTMTSFLHGKGR